MISIDTERHLTKFSTFHDKNKTKFSTLGREENFLNMLKVIFKNSTLKIYLLVKD